MIRIGNILINPEDISSVHQDLKTLDPSNDRTRGIHIIQIIYKNGVVKNYTSQEIGMSYNDFINALMELKDKEETDRIFRFMAALKSINNE